MKSIALSLLVALGVTLGSQAAFADVPAKQGSTAMIEAQGLLKQAAVHQQRASEYRAASAGASNQAADATRIMEDDLKHGFVYEAGLMREKARQYQLASQRYMAMAVKEDALAAQCRADAQQKMAQPQTPIRVPVLVARPVASPRR